MTKPNKTLLLVATLITAVSIGYCATFWFKMPLPRYYPTQHQWKCYKEQGVASQGWYAKQGFAYIVGLLATAGVAIVLKASKNQDKPLSSKTVKAISVCSILIVCACMTYITIHMYEEWISPNSPKVTQGYYGCK